MSWSALWPDTSPLRGPGARAFRAVFLSRTVVYLGSQAAEVALLVQAKQLTGSPLVVGTLGLAELVPLVVFGLYGGVLADRFDRRALMRWCEPGLALCGVLLLLNALLPHPLLWPLYVVAALMMAFASLQRPAFEAATPRIVPRPQLTAAAAILSLSTNASVLLGSSLGGVLAVAPGPWLVYALDAAGFAVSFVLLSRGVPKLPPVVADGGVSGDGTEIKSKRYRTDRCCARSSSGSGTRSDARTCSAPTWPIWPRWSSPTRTRCSRFSRSSCTPRGRPG